MHMSGRSVQPASRLIGIAITCGGALLIIGALAANQPWLDAHFLPDFFVPHTKIVTIETTVRIVVALIGLLALVSHAPIARFLASDPIRTCFVGLAILAAIAVSEIALRRIHVRAKE